MGTAMGLWDRMFKSGSWFGWKPHSPSHQHSQFLVSVYVQQTSMSPRGFSQASRRVLLTTSIWSAFLLVFAFFVTYTVVLICLGWPGQKERIKQDLLAAKLTANGRPKVRFLGRATGMKNQTLFHHGSSVLEHNWLWNPGELDDPASDKPLCKRGSVFIIIITSSPDHFEHRTEVRNTWCNPKLTTQEDNAWQCFFLIGQTNNTEINSKLKRESQRYSDTIRGSYVDSYRNLTYKVMHGFAWVSRNCDSQYVLKTDDDCFVNTLLLWQFLLHHNKQTTNLYVGNMVVDKDKRKVIRKLSEKWSVSRKDYLPEYYPLYASGSGYILSFDILHKFVEECPNSKPIPNEDAYVGVVMDRLSVQPTLSGRFTLASAGLRLCNFVYIFVAHGVEPSMQQAMHNKMLTAQSACQHEEVATDWF